MSNNRKTKSGKPKKGKTPKKKVSPGIETTDAPRLYRFTVDDKTYELDINPDHLPVRERIEIEDYLGMPWVEAAFSGWLASNKAMAFLAYIAWRRVDEDATLDAVLDSDELLVEEVEEGDRPTETPSETPEDSGAQS